MDTTGLPRPKVKLAGADGNAFSILARCQRAAKEAGWPPEPIKEFITEATSGDYNHLLQVVLQHFDERDDDSDEG